MSVRLIRENSDTPNITNKDDARMIRYAYGGQDGYAQKRGTELDYIINGNIFTIKSGLIHLQGWEIDVDSLGWSFEVAVNDATNQFIVIYCEVDLSRDEAVSIKAVSDTVDYPEIDVGDDLTENTNGVARLELYRFTAQSGVIANVEKRIQKILYRIETGARPQITQIVNSDSERIYEFIVPSSLFENQQKWLEIKEITVEQANGESKNGSASGNYYTLCPAYNSANNVIPPIMVYPTGAKESIASVEFLDGEWKNYIAFDYQPNSTQRLCIKVARLLQKIYPGRIQGGKLIDGDTVLSEGNSTWVNDEIIYGEAIIHHTYHQYEVLCKVKDLYGGEFIVKWYVGFSTRSVK